MSTGHASYPSFPVAPAIVRRRKTAPARAGLALVLAGIFQYYSNPLQAGIWLCSYALLLGVEYISFSDVHATSDLSSTRGNFYYILLALLQLTFSAYGLLLAFNSNIWGVLCAALLWSGMFAITSITSDGNLRGLLCSLIAPTVAVLSLPFLVVGKGGGLVECITIVIAGTINTAGTVWIWHSHQRLLLSRSEVRASKRLALQDADTDLPNRNALLQRIKQLETTHKEGVVVVAAISIDRYKHLHGAIGHLLMLDLLQRVAARLADAFPDAPVSRLSDAEFGLAFVARDMSEAHDTAIRMQGAVADPIVLNDNRIDVGVTIGLCNRPDDIAPATRLSIIDRALIAVDQARAARKYIAVFDPVVYGDPGASLGLMSDMLHAIATDEITLAYQPKLDLRNGKVEGVEALARWVHPTRGRQQPDVFVGMAEQTGHIAALTEWVLRRAIKDQATLRDKGLDIRISINWSGVLLNDKAFTRTTLAIMREQPCRLRFEVTETAIIGNAGLARQTLEQFRSAGIKVSIDDYGTGLSSLAYLKNIPADEMKIDQTFVRNLATDPVDAVLVRSAVNLAHSLGLNVVAEGVESREALQILMNMGCDVAQGYVISHPIPLDGLIAFLQQKTASPDALAPGLPAPQAS